MLRLPFAVLMSLPLFAAGPSAAGLSRQIHDLQLDPDECYRVFDLTLSKEDLRIYLTSGYLIFAKPLLGMRTGAVFTTDVEAGDAEVLLLPPIRSERLSLANFTESPNLDEHFKSAALVFTDNTAEQLIAKLQTGGAKKVPEMGAILKDRWGTLIGNLASSFEVRVIGDLLGSGGRAGFFYATVGGGKLGNFDMLYDPSAADNLLIGQIADRNGQNYFNVWTSFASKSHRERGDAEPGKDVVLEDFRIDATVDTDLTLKATTRFKVTANRPPGRAMAFAISRQMRVIEAKVDGQPAEVLQKESLRSNLIRATDNQEFLVVAPEDLAPGKAHEFEIRHEGQVITDGGDQVYYVGARGNWYPRRGFDFARYDLTFRYPKDLGFVATGTIVDDRTDGDWRITRRQTTNPIRFAGFNLGNYKSVSIVRDGYRVEVYANRSLERALQPKNDGAAAAIVNPGWSHRRSPDSIISSLPPAIVPNPTMRLEALAHDVDAAFEYMTAQFGPPPIKTLTVSPIPGNFGQGFPGLLYLSTRAYLDPATRPPAGDRSVQSFFSQMLDAHEVAHQWWGNLVIADSYQDAWLMEALANYSAMMFLEKKKGPRALETELEDCRTHLLGKEPSGKTRESVGPMTWGYRLQSSQSPDAWNHIVYEKGAWVIHMIRRRLGDERFAAMLRAICRRYAFQPLTTEQFRLMAKEFGPPHAPDADFGNFFDNWVYGTGIPAVKMTYTVRGLKVTGTISESGVADDFTARIPLEVQAGKTKTLYWVPATNDPTPFTIAVKAPGARVSLAVKDALMTIKK